MSNLSCIGVFKRESGFARGLRITEYNAITTRAKGRSVHGIEVTVHRVKGFPNTRIQRPNHAFSLRGLVDQPFLYEECISV
jgi:hypothetical protein